MATWGLWRLCRSAVRGVVGVVAGDRRLWGVVGDRLPINSSFTVLLGAKHTLYVLWYLP
ncbi:hypothetical protein [Microcoleus sp. T3_D1]|uniref:hypothetical protein n=1 Tax=Microcoleus sp. T3_D1 TaxID=3055427 RepID=UPI002FD6C6F3